MGNSLAKQSIINDKDEQTEPFITEVDKKDVEFKIFVGIDLGTSGWRLAYVINNKNMCDVTHTDWENLDKLQSSNQRKKIVSTNGETLPSRDVFIYELTKLRELALKFLDTKCKYNQQDIQWILTVPAIWSDFAKHKMQEWAQVAKLIDERIRNQLKIVYETD
eukprot:79588_1